MRKLATAVAALLMAGLLAGNAHAHDVTPNSGFVKDRRQAQMVRIVHSIIERPAYAHLLMRRAYCESSWRWWLKGDYWGLFQFNEDARRGYASEGLADGRWTVREQVRAVRRMDNARSDDPWPNCP